MSLDATFVFLPAFPGQTKAIGLLTETMMALSLKQKPQPERRFQHRSLQQPESIHQGQQYKPLPQPQCQLPQDRTTGHDLIPDELSVWIHGQSVALPGKVSNAPKQAPGQFDRSCAEHHGIFPIPPFFGQQTMDQLQPIPVALVVLEELPVQGLVKSVLRDGQSKREFLAFVTDLMHQKDRPGLDYWKLIYLFLTSRITNRKFKLQISLQSTVFIFLRRGHFMKILIITAICFIRRSNDFTNQRKKTAFHDSLFWLFSFPHKHSLHKKKDCTEFSRLCRISKAKNSKNYEFFLILPQNTRIYRIDLFLNIGGFTHVS